MAEENPSFQAWCLSKDLNDTNIVMVTTEKYSDFFKFILL
jgi:hypothetical protein